MSIPRIKYFYVANFLKSAFAHWMFAKLTFDNPNLLKIDGDTLMLFFCLSIKAKGSKLQCNKTIEQKLSESLYGV